jgi:hypothetical protein
MNTNRIRPYTAFTLLLTLLCLAITGLILFLAPTGPGSRFWQWLGLTKHQYKDIHLYLGSLFVILGGFHLYINLKPFKHYLNDNRRQLWQHPFLWAVAGVCVAVFLALTFDTRGY